MARRPVSLKQPMGIANWNKAGGSFRLVYFILVI